MGRGRSKGAGSTGAAASTFTPAKTIEEAEEFISKYVDKDYRDYFAPTGVSLKGLSLDVANEINKTLSELMDEYGDAPLGGVIAPAKNTKLGKRINEAVMGYSSLQGSFIINKDMFKTMKTANDYFALEGTTQDNFYAHPENYDMSRASATFRRIAEAGRQSGRMTVPRNAREAMYHEFGHYLQKRVKRDPAFQTIQNNMSKYAPRISGYAQEDYGEYIAESFASYKRGEKKIDPALAKVFNSFKKRR